MISTRCTSCIKLFAAQSHPWCIFCTICHSSSTWVNISRSHHWICPWKILSNAATHRTQRVSTSRGFHVPVMRNWVRNVTKYLRRALHVTGPLKRRIIRLLGATNNFFNPTPGIPQEHDSTSRRLVSVYPRQATHVLFTKWIRRVRMQTQ